MKQKKSKTSQPAKKISAKPVEGNIHCKYDDLVDPSKLVDYKKNRNKHGQDQIERLAEMYKHHGIRHAIIVDKKRGVIAAGHGRKLAAIRAGIKAFPVVYQEFKTDDDLYAFSVADNAIALWADLDLSAVNIDIQDLGPNFDIDWLGIKNFVIDMADKEFDPSESTESDKEQKTCPHCGETL